MTVLLLAAHLNLLQWWDQRLIRCVPRSYVIGRDLPSPGGCRFIGVPVRVVLRRHCGAER